VEVVKVGKSVFQDVLIDVCEDCGIVVVKVPEFDQIRYEGGNTYNKRPLWRLYESRLIKFLWWSYRKCGDLLAIVWFGDDRRLHVKAQKIGWSEILIMFCQSLEDKIEPDVVFYDAVPTTIPPDD